MMNIPAQITRTAGKIVHRLLSWNPWQHVFFRLLDKLTKHRPKNNFRILFWGGIQ